MQYIRCQAVIQDEEFVLHNETRESSRKLTHQIATKSKDFNDKLNKDAYIFVSCIDDHVVSIGVIADKNINVDKLFNKYVKSVGIKVGDIRKEEVTLRAIVNMLSGANRFDYVNDDDEIMEYYGLDCLVGRWGRSFEFGDTIMETPDKEEILLNASKYLSEETLKPELERIFLNSVPRGKYGHVVDYFVETDDKELTKSFYRTIMQALYNVGRLSCRRYSFVDIKPESDFSKHSYECLYKSSFGGTVVVRLKMVGELETDHASSERDNIGVVCEMMKKYRNQVLTIICLPRECTHLKEMLYEELGNITFIEIKEDFAKNDMAKNYLKMLAKDNNVRADKKLLSAVKEDQGYISNDLNQIFSEWYDYKLKNNVFTQYKETKSIKHKIQKETAKGDAYAKLNNEMIGLGEAKKVINQAIDYYKAKKLFGDRIKYSEGLENLVFLGNPGTAKSTCAALFGNIMKSNGVLSKGHTVFLNASELKAKYVGHTTPLVKKKFSEAIGGVLVLDEVYVLNNGDSFAKEATAVILSEMERLRGQLVVIFAGYPKETMEYIASNPGIKSRLGFYVNFEDLSTDELCKVSEVMAKNEGRKLSGDAMEKLRSIYEEVRKEPDFGNGRFCRSMISKAKLCQASRLVNMDYDTITDEDLETIIADDIKYEDSKEEKKRIIGFCA